MEKDVNNIGKSIIRKRDHILSTPTELRDLVGKDEMLPQRYLNQNNDIANK